MKVIVAGSREIQDYLLIVKAITSFIYHYGSISEIVSGGARGVDQLGERYSKEGNLDLKVFRADWDAYGKAAGPIRNRDMAKYADGLVAIWDGKSTGTKNMIEEANKRGLKVVIFRP